ncbi:hypothetical protein ACWDSL_41750 [Streptomyces sp. NPDC000941]
MAAAGLLELRSLTADQHTPGTKHAQTVVGDTSLIGAARRLRDALTSSRRNGRVER